MATCNEFIELREKYPQVLSLFDEEFCWGLKMNGYLFITDQIYRQKPRKILEAGAGLNLLFFRLFGKELEYWMIDNGSLYPNPIEFRENISIMKNLNFVNGLLGDFSTELPDNYFDMVFSISVLEHTPRDTPESAERICKDMYRLLKPGGCILHTIDITPGDDIGSRYLSFMKKTGFVFCEEPKEPDWDVGKPRNQILLESLDTAYLRYYEKYRELKRPIDYYHFGSIIVMAFKPAENELKPPCPVQKGILNENPGISTLDSGGGDAIAAHCLLKKLRRLKQEAAVMKKKIAARLLKRKKQL